jgi:hypothetical protein
MTDLARAERWNGRLDRLDTGIPADKVLSPSVVGVNDGVLLFTKSCRCEGRWRVVE